MRHRFVCLPVIAGVAISGISLASLWPDRAEAALVVSTGSQAFDVDWSKEVPDKQPFGIVWSKMDNSGHTITGVAAFGNLSFDGTGLALETQVDICAYSGSCAGPAGSNDHRTDSFHSNDDHNTDSDSDKFGLTGTIQNRSNHVGGDAGIDFGIGTDGENIHGPNLPYSHSVGFGTDLEKVDHPDGDFTDDPGTNIIVASFDHPNSQDPLPVSEPISLALVGGALFLFGCLRRSV